MNNSSLVSVTKLSPCHSGKRTAKIDRITPHCVVGQLDAATICSLFSSVSVNASCNYAIGTKGDIGLCVDEGNRSWCSSSKENDQRAVTIECASDKVHPFAMTTEVFESLVKLCVDICKRNGKDTLLWINNKEKALSYNPKSNEMLLTVHRWFKNKACPGDWLYERLGALALKVTMELQKEVIKPVNDVKITPVTPVTDSGDVPASYHQQACNYCIEHGIFKGDGTGKGYRWNQPLTRQEAAQLIFNLLEQKK